MESLHITVEELAGRVGGKVEGDGRKVISGIAPLDAAGPDEVTFVADARRVGELGRTRAGAAIVFDACPAASLPLVRVANVEAAVAALLGLIGDGEDLPPAGIHPSAVVDGSAEVAADAAIGPTVCIGPRARIGAGAVLCAGAVVEADVVIGDSTILLPGTVVQRRCRIGSRCRIGPNAVIGSSGFGYHFDQGRHQRVPHVGEVEIGDNVDIGAGACVDRGKFGITCIGEGTKIDNLVQVAHNVQIGRHCLLVAQVGIAGSVVLKDYVVLGGAVGVRDNITIGRGVRCGGHSAIAHDVPDGQTLLGVPARDARQEMRLWNLYARLPETNQRILDLDKRIKALESPADH